MKKIFRPRDLNLKVYVEDTDFQGFVYHANYIKFFERARSEFLQDNKISQKELRINNLAFVVKRIEIDFLFPGRLGDELVVESLIENTKFDLPKDFLERWIQVSGENPMTPEEAKAEYARSEKGLRYQLIEGKLRAEHNLQVTFDELKAYALEMIKGQMAQFGQLDPSEEELNNIASRIMSNQEEVKRLSEQLNSSKLLDFFKENAKLKTKEVSYDKFIKEAYA